MASDQLMSDVGPRYVQMRSEPSATTMTVASFFTSFGSSPEPESSRIFDELPDSTIVSVSRPDAGDITPMLLSYTIEFQYKQVKIRSLSVIVFTHDKGVVNFIWIIVLLGLNIVFMMRTYRKWIFELCYTVFTLCVHELAWRLICCEEMRQYFSSWSSKHPASVLHFREFPFLVFLNVLNVSLINSVLDWTLNVLLLLLIVRCIVMLFWQCKHFVYGKDFVFLFTSSNGG